MTGRVISTNAAIEAIRRRAVLRVHAETPALRLLSIEDKMTARIAWRERTGKEPVATEQAAVDNAREEMTRRSSAEMNTARAEWKRRNKVWSYFPDEGPLRRELYPEHIKFIAATQTDEEIMMLAANRCISPWTPVEMGSSTRQCVEMLGAGAFDVRSWDGGSRCNRRASPVFLKNIEPMFRVHLDNGQFFDCTRRHRVLLSAVSGGHRQEDWVSIDQLIHAASGLHCWKTEGNSKANYVEDDRLYDARLLSDPGIGLRLSPSQGDALQPGQLNDGREDVTERRSRRIRAYQESGHQSTEDDHSRIADLCAQFEDPSGGIGGRWTKPLLQELRLYASELHQRQPFQLRGDRQPFSLKCAGLQGFCGTAGTIEPCEIERLSPTLFASWCNPSTAKREFLEAIAHRAMFFPFDVPPLQGGTCIVSLVPIGLQPVLDFTVKSTHCYESGGVIHHNTGKTQLGALCVAHWAMGRYPHWWNGRVFDNPTTIWVCNKTAKDTRDINEAELLGPPGNEQDRGTGMIPSHLIQRCTPKPGTPHAFEFINVEHVSGLTSTIVSKSYDQGREAYQGRHIDAGWGDEEISREIWDEMLMRTMSTVPGQRSGVALATYTPILGLTEMTTWFMEAAGLSLDAMRHRGEELVDLA